MLRRKLRDAKIQQGMRGRCTSGGLCKPFTRRRRLCAGRWSRFDWRSRYVSFVAWSMRALVLSASLFCITLAVLNPKP